MDEKEVQKKIKEGGVLAQVTFEILGSPKEHIEKSMISYLGNIKNDFQITVLSEEIGEAEETEGKLWGIYAETEMIFDTIEKLVWLCINFMPANIDIIAPKDLTFKEKDLTNWLNDLLAKLHEISATVRQANIQQDAAVKGMNALIQNSLLLATEKYHKPEEISKRIGIPAKQLQPFFDALVKNEKLVKKDKEYHRKG